MASIDFFTVPTATFRVLFVFVVLSHARGRVVHFRVTEHPTQEWTKQQLRVAFSWDQAPRYLLRDRDAIYGSEFAALTKGMGVVEVVTAPRAPWQNPFVERLVGSIRRDCLDHIIVWNERSLRRTLQKLFCLLRTIQDALIAGQGRANQSSDSTASNGSGRGNSSSWRPASPLHAQSCLIEAGFQTLA
jgi:transposase InsO family protein